MRAGGPGFHIFWVGSLLNTARMTPSPILHLRVRRYGCPIVAVFARVEYCIMPKRLKRIYGFGDLHFITFGC
jgi:hypothetical protein